MSVAYLRTLRVGHALLSPRPEWPGPSADVRRILVAGQMGIGNMIMFTPFLKTLRAGFPEAHIAIAFWKRNGAEQVVQGSPLVDEIIELESHALPTHQRVRIGVQLGRRGWDMGIARFNGGSPEIMSALVFGRVPYRVGHVTSGGWYTASGNDYLFNIPVRMEPGTREIDRYLAIASQLGLRADDRQPMVYVEPSDHADATATLGELGIGEGQDFVAIQVGSSAFQAWKRWPTEKWNRLVRMLSRTGVPVIALGSTSERELIDEVCRGTDAVNAAGKCSLRASACILMRARLLVCPDSGLMHMASALGTPVVTMFGGTDLLRTAPFGEGHAVLRTACCATLAQPCYDINGVLRPGCDYAACMNTIQPETAFEAAMGLLQRRHASV